MKLKLRRKVPLITNALVALTAVTNAQQTTLLTAESYDILVLAGGQLKNLQDGDYGSGKIGVAQNAGTVERQLELPPDDN